jgi:cytochrome c553
MRVTMILLALASLCACDRNVSKSEGATVPATPAALTFDGATATDRAAMLAHGERLSHILGCRGCHTETLEGQWFNDDSPEMGKLYASNLTRVLPTMTDVQLETLLRTGHHPTRADLWIMPSEIFQRLSNADMKALIAHLRTVPPSGKPTPPPALSDRAKALVAKKELKPVSAYMAEYRTKLPPDMGEEHAQGRYIAGATCSECHGADLTGIPDFGPGLNTPNLDIAGTYSAEELTTLLTTGKGRTPRDLGLMSLVGKEHFSHLTPHERSAVIAYVKARADRPQ